MPEISVVVYRELSEPRQGLQRLTREAPACTQHRDTVTDFAAARESRRHVNRHRWGYIYRQTASTTGGRRQPTPLGLHLQTRQTATTGGGRQPTPLGLHLQTDSQTAIIGGRRQPKPLGLGV